MDEKVKEQKNQDYRDAIVREFDKVVNEQNDALQRMVETASYDQKSFNAALKKAEWCGAQMQRYARNLAKTLTMYPEGSVILTTSEVKPAFTDPPKESE